MQLLKKTTNAFRKKGSFTDIPVLFVNSSNGNIHGKFI